MERKPTSVFLSSRSMACFSSCFFLFCLSTFLSSFVPCFPCLILFLSRFGPWFPDQIKQMQSLCHKFWTVTFEALNNFNQIWQWARSLSDNEVSKTFLVRQQLEKWDPNEHFLGLLDLTFHLLQLCKHHYGKLCCTYVVNHKHSFWWSEWLAVILCLRLFRARGKRVAIPIAHKTLG